MSLNNTYLNLTMITLDAVEYIGDLHGYVWGNVTAVKKAEVVDVVD